MIELRLGKGYVIASVVLYGCNSSPMSYHQRRFDKPAVEVKILISNYIRLFHAGVVTCPSNAFLTILY